MKPNEFKFRVWDYDTRSYSHFIELDRDKNILFSFPIQTKHIEILLCSGLKDKKGNDIYEGDILVEKIGKEEIYSVVKFADGIFWLGAIQLVRWVDRIEIIGNVYENPELLEQK